MTAYRKAGGPGSRAPFPSSEVFRHPGFCGEAAGVDRPLVEKAWRAILARTSPDGRVLDTCESTNQEQSVEAYLKRAAIADRGPRAGAVALMFALEMAGL
jgi:hypothetical protein